VLLRAWILWEFEAWSDVVLSSRKIKPGSEDKVAQIFAESDTTALPHTWQACGITSLFVLDDIYARSRMD